MKANKRAIRRYHNERIKNGAEHIFCRYGCSKENARKLANNMKMCTCYLCGNPRRWNGEITKAEKFSEKDLTEHVT